MTVLAVFRDCRIHPDAVVRDTENKISFVSEFHVEATRRGVGAGIPDGLVANAVDLIAHKGMHVQWSADDGDGGLVRAVPPAVFNGTAKRFGEISNDFTDTGRLKNRALGSRGAFCWSKPSERPDRTLPISEDFRGIGRGEWIRTTDPSVPNRVLYQAEPRPDSKA
jgi:hypothetical protein